MKRRALAVAITLLTGCVSNSSSTTTTSERKPREGRGVEYPKEVPLGGRMHIEAWGCKGHPIGTINLSPPPADLNNPRSYGPNREIGEWIGGHSTLPVDEEGRLSTDLYIRPDGVEGRYRVSGLCYGPGDVNTPYADLEQWFNVLPKRVVPDELRTEKLVGRRVPAGAQLTVEGSSCLQYFGGSFPEAIVYIYSIDRVEKFRFPTGTDGSWSGTIIYPFDRDDRVALLAQCAYDDLQGFLERGVISPDALPPGNWTIKVAR